MDLIERQSVIDDFYHIKCNLQMMDDSQSADKIIHGLWLAENAVKLLPSAEPQIIRCKDCEYSRSGKNMVVGEWWQCSYKGRWDVVAKDHYCGHAERKEDG